MIRRPIVFTLAALALARPLLAQCPDGTPPPCRARGTRVAAAPATNSVAVLYFDNTSRDSNDAYLADGLTEEIIGRLSAVERLAVKSHHAVRRYRGAALEDLAPVARQLNVSYLVTGSIRRAGDRLRVRAELVRAAGGLQVWGRSFDQTGTDLFAIQEAVAREVATGIVGRLLPTERAAVEARPARDPAAYDHLLRGNFYLAQRSAQSVSRAIEEYEAASRLDPSYVDALARVPYAYALFLDWGWGYPGVPAESLLQRGLRATERALRLDSLSSDAWMARGYLSAFADPRAFTGLREGLGRAIALDPRNAEAWHQLGAQLQTLGDDSAAAAADLHALALDPARPITLRNLGGISRDQRRYPEALRWLDSAAAVAPRRAMCTGIVPLSSSTSATSPALARQPCWRSGTWPQGVPARARSASRCRSPPATARRRAPVPRRWHAAYPGQRRSSRVSGPTPPGRCWRSVSGSAASTCSSGSGRGARSCGSSCATRAGIRSAPTRGSSGSSRNPDPPARDDALPLTFP